MVGELVTADGAIRDLIIQRSPQLLAASLALFLVFLLFCSRDIFREFEGMSRKTLLALVGIMLFGLALRALAVPRTHRLYFDEDIYIETGKEMLESGRACLCNFGTAAGCSDCILSKWPGGYPFALSVAYAALGASEESAFVLNLLVSFLGSLLIFALAYLSFSSEEAGLYAALLYSLCPVLLYWSGTAASEPLLMLFLMAVWLCLLFYIRRPGWKRMGLLCCALAYTIQIKIETGIIVPIAVLAILLSGGFPALRRRHFWAGLLLLLTLVCVHLVHVYMSMTTASWGSEGPNFSLDYAKENFPVNLLFFLGGYSGSEHLVVLTVFFLLGALWGLKEFPGETGLLLLWFVPLFLLYAFFYAGSVRYGVDVRYTLSWYPAVIALGGLGMAWARRWLGEFIRHPEKLVVGVVLLNFLVFFPAISTPSARVEEAIQARTYHDFMRENAELVRGCYVVSHVSSMWIMWGVPSAQPWYLENDELLQELREKAKCIVFDYGFWCNVPPYKDGSCKNILDKFGLIQIARMDFRESDSFVLYEVPPDEVNDLSLTEVSYG